MSKRVFLFVLDSFGIGEEPDAADFGDAGTSTVRSCASSKFFDLSNMGKLGFFNIDNVANQVAEGISRRTSCEGDVMCAESSDLLEKNPIGAYGRLQEKSMGKDTTIGHWEIAGIYSESPLPTYPDGFPDEVIEEFSKLTGRGVLCNKPYSGTEVIKDYGDEHIRTGDLIVYTSADSVFQIAAHEEVVPLETLYEYCRMARKMLQGKHGVGRVIARPFVGSEGNYTRTSHRHDFSLVPPTDTMLDKLMAAGFDTLAIGKIQDIFVGKGISEYTYTSGNTDGMDKTMAWADRDFNGLCFINLVDYDMLYGHRRDIDGYAKALNEFDKWLPGFMDKMGDEDLIMITADHGCDPGYLKTTDHTREYIPLLIWGPALLNKGENLGTKLGFDNIAEYILNYFNVE